MSVESTGSVNSLYDDPFGALPSAEEAVESPPAAVESVTSLAPAAQSDLSAVPVAKSSLSSVSGIRRGPRVAMSQTSATVPVSSPTVVPDTAPAESEAAPSVSEVDNDAVVESEALSVESNTETSGVEPEEAVEVVAAEPEEADAELVDAEPEDAVEDAVEDVVEEAVEKAASPASNVVQQDVAPASNIAIKESEAPVIASAIPSVVPSSRQKGKPSVARSSIALLPDAVPSIAPSAALPAALPAVIPATSARKRGKPRVARSIAAPSQYEGFADAELLEAWNTTIDMKERDDLIKVLQRRSLFPSAAMDSWEYQTGAYPDIIDPQFLQKLLTKREFAESLQYTWNPNPEQDPCDDQTTFEVTPVQRFVTNFMSPKTPYMSALLYHGVGVGKTCAGVQIMEAWLESYPRTEVYLVAPPTIQQGFYRTIFDINKVVIGEGNDPNSALQCTGTTYMKLTNTLYERDKAKIEKAVAKAIKRRYKIFGYISFANYIRDLLKRIPIHASPEEADLFKKQIIRQHFSAKLLIVDEAHNLRDISKVAEEKDEIKDDESDTAGGKLLTPYLMDVLSYSEGMKFCVLTATPMYNSYLEIIFILNLLLRNDKKAELISSDIFDSAGNITEQGRQRLSYTTSRYVSFMRGENPISFPVRLFPQSIPAFGVYPRNNPRGVLLEDDERTYFQRLPLVPILLQEDTLRASLAFTNSLVEGGSGLNTVMLEKLVHAGNIVVPATESTQGNSVEAYTMRTDKDSLNTVFQRETSGGHSRYRAKSSVTARWLVSGALAPYSPKFQFFIERARNAEGCVFAYTRFVTGGALPMALVLEANGYLPYNGKHLLADGIQAPGGKQCALCPRKEKEHADAGHAFSPAYYGILTGNIEISPNNELTITTQRALDNKDGRKIKVLIGSQIASEGVDLRFVRETHIIDSWFHLNKTEQIIGRAIRFLSHCALPKEKRNNTIYLYAAVFPSEMSDRETADLYSYRVGFKKSVLIGRVSRIMKQSALDCNLNQEAIIIRNQDPIMQIDSQRMRREQVNINDMPFTAVCDWIETCDYTCQPKIDVSVVDDSTYDEFSARWRIYQIKQLIRERFEEQSFFQSEDLWSTFALLNIPRLIATDVLREIVNNKTFQIRYRDQSGYIRFCNGYYLFQPNVYEDLTIPLAIRVARFPVKRDQYQPIAYQPIYREESKQEHNSELESVETYWKSIVDWVQELSSHARYSQPPADIAQHIKSTTDTSSETYIQMIEMIEMFHSSFHRSEQKNPESFRKAVSFYFWDEWLTLEEQTYLVKSTGMNLHEYIKENQYQFSKFTVNRFLNPKTGEISVTCENADQKECDAVASQLARSTSDPLRQFQVNKKTTGSFYGYVVPKSGHMVFKTNEAPEVNGKIGRGSECIIVSNIKERLVQLISIGDLLKAHRKTDFNLNKESLFESHMIKGSTRVCTLLNLLLRFLDAERLDNKRWFFRSVEAYYTGHKGTVRK